MLCGYGCGTKPNSNPSSEENSSVHSENLTPRKPGVFALCWSRGTVPDHFAPKRAAITAARAVLGSSIGHASNQESIASDVTGDLGPSPFGVATELERGERDCCFPAVSDGCSNPVPPIATAGIPKHRSKLRFWSPRFFRWHSTPAHSRPPEYVRPRTSQPWTARKVRK